MTKDKNAPASIRSPFDSFQTDPDLERAGVTVDYDGYWFKIARAGGANEAFAKRLNELTQPYKRAIESEAITPKLAQKLTRQAFCETVLLGWGSEAFGEGNMVGPDRQALPYTVDNALGFFESLPDLLSDLLSTAQRAQVFRRSVVEADAKNSGPSSATS